MTANPEKGETRVVIGGDEYVLAMTFNGMIALQQLFEKDGEIPPLEKILLRAQKGDLVAFRAVFWASLRRHHPSITVEQTGELIDAAGGVQALDLMLMKVHLASGPDRKDEDALRALRPPKAATKTRTRRGGIGAH